ncbi:hypothetical protein KR032_007554, partial [Drosophila birchii]
SLEMDSSFCDSLSNGFYEYPYDCSAYISCNDSCADLEYCPNGKLFNSPLHICDTPEAVKCTPLPYPSNPCKDETNFTIIPSTLSCDEFIVCMNGQSEVTRCPGELLFNPDLKICDFKDNVWCYGDRTTQDGQDTTSTIGEAFTDCEGQKLGALFPDILNCQQYYYCWGNDSYSIFPCPIDNWFNPNSGNCGPDISPEACREVVTTQTTITSPSTTVGTTTTVGISENPCEDQELGASFPLQSDCQQYLLCLGGGQSTTAKCPVNAWFDPTTGDCGPNVSPTACLDAFSTSTTVATTESSDDPCANQELGVSYPLVTNCQQYVLCMGDGTSTVANCIYNSWYDPRTGICGPEVSPTACKESTESSTSVATTTALTTTPLPTMSTTISVDTTTSPSDILGICFGHNEDYYASYPEDCSKYIACARPVPIAFYCPQSLFFNEALQRCVDWQSSDCPQGETTTASPGLTTPAPDTSVCFNNSGQNLPYQENCQWFIRCVDDSSYMMGICSTEEFFDPLTGECGPDVLPDACRNNYATTTTISTTDTDSTESSTTAITPSTPGTETDPCEGVPNGKLVPYPNDCTKFIACVQPYPLVYDCVIGQEFSAALERCMAPWYANCSIILTTTQAPLTTEPQETPLPNSFCDDKSEGTLVPYPNNCSKYIVCQDPIPVGYACPENEEFSPIDLICMDAKQADCNSTGFSLRSPDNAFFLRALKSFGSFSIDF